MISPPDTSHGTTFLLNRLFRLATSGGLAFVLRVGGAAAGVLMNVAVTRAMGAEEAGRFFVGQIIMITAAMFARLGLDSTIVRQIAAKKVTNDRRGMSDVILVSVGFTGMALCLAGSAVWLAGHELPVFWDPGGYQAVIRSTAWAMIPFALTQLLAFGFQGLGRINTYMCFAFLAFPGSVILLTQLDDRFGIHDAADLMLAAAIVNALIVVVAGLIWFRFVPPRRYSRSIDPRQMIADSVPLLSASGITQGNRWASQLILAFFASPAVVAALSNANRAAGLVSFLLTAVDSVVAPRFATLSSLHRSDAIRRLVYQINGLIIAVSAPIVVLVFIFAEPIMGIFGDAFRPHANLLRILAIGQFINAATGCVRCAMVMCGHGREFRNAIGWSAVIGIVVALILTPWLGGIGAAISAAVAASISNVAAAIVMRSVMDINVFNPANSWNECFHQILRLSRGARMRTDD
ncbi:lipopolysaccharide biosynthesis protein [Crateriforma conspicua]|uniref:Polysaccharide biosynthesis protein n=1 Tax=Crateriforma conspicua TaxID=2527996 RepID=A0A5C6FZ65_9PLAN|nr:oligosaccharide flippase family protein [Crateriforma conspicua]TWU67666.1 Polysaccharide biosynthesis protein [Crateriforma conspicua]